MGLAGPISSNVIYCTHPLLAHEGLTGAGTSSQPFSPACLSFFSLFLSLLLLLVPLLATADTQTPHLMSLKRVTASDICTHSFRL